MTTVESTLSEFDEEIVPVAESPFEMVCRLHRKHLYRYLLKVTLGDRREAEDLVQETMFRAWRHLQDHAADAERLRPWLFTVGRRVAIDAARARKVRPSEVILTDLGTLPADHDDIERAVLALTIRRGLMSLSPQHRQVLIEVFYHDRTTRDAAELLNVPEGTVKSRIHYALRALAAATQSDSVRR
jgi:RNA polymerase sigma-70 factor (ECF subfamily)